jgi:hypothetical protein
MMLNVFRLSFFSGFAVISINFKYFFLYIASLWIILKRMTWINSVKVDEEHNAFILVLNGSQLFRKLQ